MLYNHDTRASRSNEKKQTTGGQVHMTDSTWLND